MQISIGGFRPGAKQPVAGRGIDRGVMGSQFALAGPVRGGDCLLSEVFNQPLERPLGAAGTAQAAIYPLPVLINSLIDGKGVGIAVFSTAAERTEARRKFTAAPLVRGEVSAGESIKIDQALSSR